MRLLIASLILCGFVAQAQYTFTPVTEVSCTDVKSQDRTGTCWSYATTSFVESELIKTGRASMNLSEMFIVRHIYIQKAINYVLRQGNAKFSQGSLAHDQLNAFFEYGIVPENVYPGKNENEKHNHGELVKVLKGFLDGVLSQKKPSKNWLPAFKAILDVYLGEVPQSFTFNGKQYTPKEFASSFGLKRSQFVGFTSFTHHPFNEEFIIEIPDNFSNGSYQNIELENLMQITDEALKNGYTVAWDGDVSEKGFSAKNGIAILPKDKFDEKMLDNPVAEKEVNQENRQDDFWNWNTTDDHLMHIVGIAKDQDGTKYYKVKNSWGELSDYKGFLYMSEAYFKAKTVCIYINKDAIKNL